MKQGCLKVEGCKIEGLLYTVSSFIVAPSTVPNVPVCCNVHALSDSHLSQLTGGGGLQFFAK